MSVYHRPPKAPKGLLLNLDLVVFKKIGGCVCILHIPAVDAHNMSSRAFGVCVFGGEGGGKEV